MLKKEKKEKNKRDNIFIFSIFSSLSPCDRRRNDDTFWQNNKQMQQTKTQHKKEKHRRANY